MWIRRYVKTPNYILTEDYTYKVGASSWDTVTIPQGTFVRPIHLSYVPKHVTEDKRWETFNNILEVFCYYQKGIIPLPIRILREV